MTRGEWATLGLFSGVVIAIAFWETSVARKLVLVVGFLALIAGSKQIGAMIDRYV